MISSIKRTSITSKKYLVPFTLVTSLFFMWGFARAILDVLNKHFQSTLDISITQSSLIQVITYLGYFIMAIPAGLFINRYGYRWGVVFGLSMYAVGSFLFIPCAHVGTLGAYLGALFVIACGLTFLETSANPYATELGPRETATSRLNLSQSFNGLGCSLAPMLMGGFLFNEKNADLTLPYTIMGGIVVLVALVFSKVKLPEIPNEEADKTQAEQTGSQKLVTLLHNKLFLFGFFALLAYEVSEISINSYFVNFTTGMGWLDAAKASYILGYSLFIFMGGRFIGSWMMRKIPAEKMLMYCAAGSTLCILALILSSNAEQGATGLSFIPIGFLMLNYLFEAIMFPTIFALTIQGLGNLSKSASSILMMTPVGGCGFLLMAYLADTTSSLVIPLSIPLIGFVIVLLYARKKVTIANA